jgi:hypothetical protein|nr:hypothetical protein [uncultured Butyrivibrio sp.]
MNGIEELYAGISEISREQKITGKSRIEDFMAEIVIASLQRIPKKTIKEVVEKSGLDAEIEQDLVSYINGIG